MTKLKFIKLFKAYFIKYKLHYIFGYASNLLIYAGYLSKLSQWIEKNKKSLIYNDFYNSKVDHGERIKLYEFLFQHKNLHTEVITYIEFGVGFGNSMTWWTKNNSNPESSFFGFDTFVGLPEQYGADPSGAFSMFGNFPDIKDSRITFVKGLFQDTLLKTIPKFNLNRKCIFHIDGDLYSSTLFPLTILFPYFKTGDLIIFDEFVVPGNEFKAFDDFTKSFYIHLEPIAAKNNYLQMVFEVKDIIKKG